MWPFPRKSKKTRPGTDSGKLGLEQGELIRDLQDLSSEGTL